MRLSFIHEMCKAKEYNGQKIQYIQQKLDGHRLTVLLQPRSCSNHTVYYTRSQSDLFPEMNEKAQRHNIWPWMGCFSTLPPRTSIDGELYVPGRKASYVKTAIKNCDPNLRFAAFALPWLNGVRYYSTPLEDAMTECARHHIEFLPFIKLDYLQVVDAEEWIAKARPETEGWVLKQYQYSGWYRIKRVKTIDLVVLGVTKGNGKYEGLIGSLICGAYDAQGTMREISTCSGMTDAERKSMSEDDCGRVCEVSYQEDTSLGRLRHANFVQWRPDKQPFECTLAQDTEILRYWSRA